MDSVERDVYMEYERRKKERNSIGVSVWRIIYVPVCIICAHVRLLCSAYKLLFLILYAET